MALSRIPVHSRVEGQLLTTRAQYAVRAVLYVAQNGGPGPVGVRGIARDLDLPRNYLSKTMHELARAGVLHSVRGKHGGFQLAVPAAALALRDVVAVFEAAPEPPGCLLGPARCDLAVPCPGHALWQRAVAGLGQFLATTTVADLLRPGPASGAAHARHLEVPDA